MDLLREFFSRLRDLESLLTWGGYPVLMAIIFSETGLLIGFFLPGDSLLVTAGVLVNANQINPLALPTGCRFHTRCPFVVEDCKKVEPGLVEVKPGHAVACLRVERGEI